MDALDESISFYREGLEAVRLLPPEDPLLAKVLDLLALDLQSRYNKLGNIEDLEDSISFQREALVLRPPGHPDRPASLNNLAVGVSDRYDKFGKLEDLEHCIYFYREALALHPPGHPDRAASLNNLASALNDRYGRLGKTEDLEDCISFHRAALALRPPGHRDRAKSLNNLANALNNQYAHLRKTEDLEDCISLHREALVLRPPGHSDRSSSLNNLASALSSRYAQFLRIEDMEDCIAFHRDALALRPPGHPNHSVSLNNLANALNNRFDKFGGMEDLEACISLHREALALRPPGHPSRSLSLNNLANALSSRYMQFGKIEDLEDCICCHRDALALRPPGHPDRSASLKNLARALNNRYGRLGKTEDLEDRISFLRDALALRPPGHPERSSSLSTLAEALKSWNEQFGTIEDLQEAFTCYEQATSDPTSYLRDRLTAAMLWAPTARYYEHASIVDVYTTSMHLLNRFLISHLDVESQHEFLATAKIFKPLASDAASAAIEAKNLELAVELLEQGRALLWSKVDGYKYPLEQLRQVQGGAKLADRFETLGTEMENLVLSSDGASFEARLKQHRIRSEEWESLVGKIREIEGFGNFLQALPFSALISAAAEGPVILVNISGYRSDAIILHIDNPPVLVTLPRFNIADLDGKGKQLRSGQGTIGVLRFLWDKIVGPVVTCLEELGVEMKSRIWWCPTAELCALPLHAAGPYRPRERNLPDIYTSAYTSTLSSLIRARSNVIQLPVKTSLLVVAQPHETLKKVGEEVEVIQRTSDVVDVLLGAEASREAVLDGLKQHSWVHFACHGHLGDDAHPFQASFELYEGRRLTLLELIRARLPNAELAFLSACHSAAGDSLAPDENIHLSAALQFCGFRSVVGTLWEMNDEDGPMISEEFYKYMFRNPGKTDFRDSAHALSSAIRVMRKAKLPPERWIMFVHIGA